jgi:hypothetical protein
MREEDRPPCSEQGTPIGSPEDDDLARGPWRNRPPENIHVFKEKVKLFLSECPQRLAEIRDCINRKDPGDLHIALQKLHESVCQFGPSHATETASKVAALADNGDWSAADDAYHGLHKAMHKLMPMVAALAIDAPP